MLAPSINHKEFEMIVRKLRLQRGWSQEQLAAFTGLERSHHTADRAGSAARTGIPKALAAVFELKWRN
jgi:transcriptional regulator with XRE-family HTH domain